jgi:hypothetical protein
VGGKAGGKVGGKVMEAVPGILARAQSMEFADGF